jgi:predicted phage tail protein
MFRQIDGSQRISSLIERLSAWLARRRGLPIVLGILLIIISFILQIINGANPSAAVDTAATITLYLGLLLALIGIALVEPLGR